MPDLPSLVVLGSAIVDTIFHVRALPKLGEAVFAQTKQVFPGGKGVNQAVAAARLGAHTAFIGAVGRDPEGELIRSVLVDTEAHLLTVEDAPTGTAAVTVAEGGLNQIIVSTGANDRLTGAFITQTVAGLTPDCLLAQLEVPDEPLIALFAAFPQAFRVLNAAPARAFSPELWALLDAVIVNETEAHALTGRYPEDEASQRACLHELLKFGPREAVVTLGALGSAWSNGDSFVFVPAEAFEAVDSTGAGDAFCAAWCLRPDLEPALRLAFANRVGGLATRSAGALSALPTMAEALERPALR